MSSAGGEPGFRDACAMFRTATQGPWDEVPLARGALLIALCERPGLDVADYEQRIDRIADEARRRLQATAGDPLPARAAPLHELLFDELGFYGDEQRAASVEALLLPDVLDSRCGMPVTLAALYAEVGRRAGLPADIVGLPGHVIARLGTPPPPGGDPPAEGAGAAGDPGTTTLVDVFAGGRLLSVADCRAMVRSIYGGRTVAAPHTLAAITARQVLQRMILTLKALALEDGDDERRGRALELQLALFPWDLDGIRERGLMHERSERYSDAIPDLEAYVRYRPGAPDAHAVAEALRTARAHERERPRSARR